MMMKLSVLSLLLATAVSRPHTIMTATTTMRGGASSTSYAAQLGAIQSAVLQDATASIEALRQTIIDQSTVVPDLGQQADDVVNAALQAFAAAAPAAEDAAAATAYDAALAAVEQQLDAPLQLLYTRQLAAIRTAILEEYRSVNANTNSDYEKLLQADASFVAQAEASSRAGWEYATERAFLQAVLNNLAAATGQATATQLQAQQQQQTAMQFLQSQQQMIQQLQMQLYGQTSPWNVGLAYRIPDTNLNLSGNYAQGRTTVQVSCVPDESAALLGPNGFTNGVGPGNLGLSLNLSI